MFEVGRLVARVSLEGQAQFTKDTRSLGQEFKNLSSDSRQALGDVGRSLAGVGAGILALAGLAITRFATFDKAMSQVSATTGEGAEQMGKLRQAAIEAGASSVFTAQEAANAQNELAKAGVNTANILGGGLAGSLALAAAGQIGVADAAEIASTAMTQFRLSGEKIPHLADLLANGANKAQGGVQELSMALKQSGLVASQMGLSVEDTIGTLSAFASAGLLGSDAGTSFRTMLLSLANPSREAAATLKQYNIQAYDAQGNFVGITSLAGQLKAGLSEATQAQRDQALATIFGSDAIRAANVLYAQGAEGIDEWRAAVDESGAAARTAAELQNNLAGDVEKLGGAFDSALIQAGEGANGVLRDMVQQLTVLVDWYGQLDPAVQQSALAIGVGTGAVLLFGGMILMTIPKIAEFRLAMTTISTQMPVFTSRLKAAGAFIGGPWGILLGAGIAMLAVFGARTAEATANSKVFTETLDEQTGAFTDNTRAAIIKSLQDKGLFEFAKRAGISQKELTNAVFEGGDALTAIEDKFKGLNTITNLWGDTNAFAAGNASDALKGLTGELDMSKDAWQNTNAAQDGAAGSADAAADSYEALEDEIDGVVTSVTDLAAELAALNGQNLDAREAARQLESAYDEFDESLKENGATLDTTTAQGRANEAALDAIAEAALKSAEAIAEGGGSYEDYQASLETSRAAILTRINDLGITGQAAEDLANEILAIPTKAEFTAYAETAAAEARLKRLNDLIRGVGGTATLHIANGRGGGGMTQADGAIVKYYAGGGTFRENHVAQIARAGTTRVWAEPETGGELYAPLGASKRQRSLSIIGQQLAEWGFDMVPRKGKAGTGSPTGGSSDAPMRIVGTLDLGGGLSAQIDAQIETALGQFSDDVAVDAMGGSSI